MHRRIQISWIKYQLHHSESSKADIARASSAILVTSGVRPQGFLADVLESRVTSSDLLLSWRIGWVAVYASVNSNYCPLALLGVNHGRYMYQCLAEPLQILNINSLDLCIVGNRRRVRRRYLRKWVLITHIIADVWIPKYTLWQVYLVYSAYLDDHSSHSLH